MAGFAVAELISTLKNAVTSPDVSLERLCATIRPVHALKQDRLLEQIQRIPPVAGHSPTTSLPSTFLSLAQVLIPHPRPRSRGPPRITMPSTVAIENGSVNWHWRAYAYGEMVPRRTLRESAFNFPERGLGYSASKSTEETRPFCVDSTHPGLKKGAELSNPLHVLTVAGTGGGARVAPARRFKFSHTVTVTHTLNELALGYGFPFNPPPVRSRPSPAGSFHQVWIASENPLCRKTFQPPTTRSLVLVLDIGGDSSAESQRWLPFSH
ncbi:hypothetical protein FA13DRAFT_1707926 [Coprinellus micaceus]|uniref:Uncharacterized protein n=1 Tax=Coprinellus micaceus TaxID=71717 RepID=A0A4Y7TIB8_COPMI|nr:hypothetical protein FA13DRAFT_1707926 [Coprinellus micaceus]